MRSWTCAAVALVAGGAPAMGFQSSGSAARAPGPHPVTTGTSERTLRITAGGLTLTATTRWETADLNAELALHEQWKDPADPHTFGTTLLRRYLARAERVSQEIGALRYPLVGQGDSKVRAQQLEFERASVAKYIKDVKEYLGEIEKVKNDFSARRATPDTLAWFSYANASWGVPGYADVLKSECFARILNLEASQEADKRAIKKALQKEEEQINDLTLALKIDFDERERRLRAVRDAYVPKERALDDRKKSQYWPLIKHLGVERRAAADDLKRLAAFVARKYGTGFADGRARILDIVKEQLQRIADQPEIWSGGLLDMDLYCISYLARDARGLSTYLSVPEAVVGGKTVQDLIRVDPSSPPATASLGASLHRAQVAWNDGSRTASVALDGTSARAVFAVPKGACHLDGSVMAVTAQRSTGETISFGVPLSHFSASAAAGLIDESAVENLERLTDDLKRRLAETTKLRKDWDDALARSVRHLNHAADYLVSFGEVEAVLERTAAQIQTVEDWGGYVGLCVALGRGALKLALKHLPVATLSKSAKDVVNLRRALKAFGEDVPPWLEAEAPTLDSARRRAMREVRDQMAREGKRLEPIGSTAEALGDRPVTNYKGIDSDMDFLLDPVDERAFKQRVVSKVNDELAAGGASVRITDPEQLRINAFTTNLSLIDIEDPANLASYLRQLHHPNYLGAKDAYRTYGAQKLALAATGVPSEARAAGQIVRFDPVDGADIAYEMATRAEILWRNKTYLDPLVFKDLTKTYERAVKGYNLARGGQSVEMAAGTWKEASESLVGAQQAALLRQAKPYLDGSAGVPPSRELAESMMQHLRVMKGELPNLPLHPPGSARTFVQRHTWDLLDVEAGGSLSRTRLTSTLLPGVVPDAYVGRIEEALGKQARAQWSEELGIGRLLGESIRPPAEASVAAALLEGAAVWGNPIANAFRAFGRELIDTSASEGSIKWNLDQVVEALAASDELWDKYLDAALGLERACGQDGDLMRMAEEALADLPPNKRDCVERLVKSRLEELGLPKAAQDHAEFARGRQRMLDSMRRYEMIEAELEARGFGERIAPRALLSDVPSLTRGDGYLDATAFLKGMSFVPQSLHGKSLAKAATWYTDKGDPADRLKYLRNLAQLVDSLRTATTAPSWSLR